MTATAVVKAKPKWFLASKGIWGAIIGAVTIAAPVFSQWTGIDLTPVVQGAQEVGQQADKIYEAGSTALDTVMKAAGGVATLVLGFWSRFQKKISPIVVGSTSEAVAMDIPKTEEIDVPPSVRKTNVNRAGDR